MKGKPFYKKLTTDKGWGTETPGSSSMRLKLGPFKVQLEIFSGGTSELQVNSAELIYRSFMSYCSRMLDWHLKISLRAWRLLTSIEWLFRGGSKMLQFRHTSNLLRLETDLESSYISSDSAWGLILSSEPAQALLRLNRALGYLSPIDAPNRKG